MDKKIALVLDTNFVFAEANQMDKLLDKLSVEYEVYISQVSIDERKAQRCREFEKRYIDFHQFCLDFRFLFTIDDEIDCKKAQDKLRKRMQKKYEIAFSEHIIPLKASKELLEKVLERANRKCPPFIAEEKASDKGFKDTLIWLSILEYFKGNDVDEVVFLTSDNGFKKDTGALCQEFQAYTGKNIFIKDNGYYTSLLMAKESENNVPKQELPLPNVNQLREKIHEVIQSLCGIESVDHWGNLDWDRTFTLNQKVESDYMEVVFAHLKQDISNNIFETVVPADQVLGLDDRVTNGVSIPMSALEGALSLYEEIENKFRDFLPQFYSASANVINTNFIEPQVTSSNNDELPF